MSSPGGGDSTQSLSNSEEEEEDTKEDMVVDPTTTTTLQATSDGEHEIVFEQQQPNNNNNKNDDTTPRNKKKKSATMSHKSSSSSSAATKADQLLSVATQHEAEAETKLLQALEHERLLAQSKQQQHHEQRVNASFAGDVPRVGLPTSSNQTSSSSSFQTARSSLLASRAQYVMALQEESVAEDAAGGSAHLNVAAAAEPFSSSHLRVGSSRRSRAQSFVAADEPEIQDLPRASSDSMERIHQAGPVFRKAAARFQRRKAQREALAQQANMDNNHHQNEDNNNQDTSRPAMASRALTTRNTTTDQSADDLERGKPDTAHTYMGAFAAFPKKARKAIVSGLEVSRNEWSSLNDFFRPKRQSLRHELFHMTLFLFVPCLILAIILFYGVDNPPTGRCNDDNDDPNCGKDNQASASWWILFLGVRQVIVFMLAKGSDIFVIDFLVLQHPRIVKLLGARISLMIVQSKGWPSVFFWWALWDSILLYGKGPFKKHWLYWQDAMTIFTDENPSGDATYSSWHSGIILAALLISVSVALKRHFLGLYLGGRIYNRFNERVEETMKEIGLVSELSLWARRKREQHATYAVWLARFAEEEDVSESVTMPPSTNMTTAEEGQEAGGDTTNRTQRFDTDRFVSERGEELDYDEILDHWDEPKRQGSDEVSGNHIIEFRQAFSVMTKPYFFSSAFGPVDTRKQCIMSADRLFRRLLKLFEEEDTIEVSHLMRWLYKGYHRPEEKENVAYWNLLLNPDVEGRITIVDFVKGIDAVYKKLRLLENAVANASHIDRGYERVINIVFYICVFFFCLAILGLDVLNFILGISTLLVAFSFMIGPGAASYFDGVMMILGRQPYDVGDKIAIGAVDEHPEEEGSPAWMVENVDLVTTTARLMSTNEVASFSNGSLAGLRLMNMNRSPNSIVHITVRFSTETPYSKIMLFKAAVRRFVEDRPQEWQQMLGFRTESVDSDESYIEYRIYLMHKLPWRDRLAILESKATVAGFCVESQKQLSCRFTAPPKSSINISLSNDDDDDNDDDLDSQGKPVDHSLRKLMKLATLFKTSDKKEESE